MEHLIPDLAGLLGLDPTTTLFFWFLLYVAANAISRLIPEDAIGWRLHVRKVASVVGVHVKNRVHDKVTPEAMTQAMIVEATRLAPIRPPEPTIEPIPIPAEVAAYLQSQMPPSNETDDAR